MPRLIAILIVCILAGCCAARGPAGSGTHRPRVTGTFSSLHYSEESGDLGGMEISIIPADVAGEWQFFAVFQVAFGVPEEPILVPAKITGSQVEFGFPGGGGFTGEVMEVGLRGTVTYQGGVQEIVTLPRKKSYWQ